MVIASHPPTEKEASMLRTLATALFLAVFAFVAFAPAVHAEENIAKPGYKYICPCGPDCQCKTISDSPGKCACGKTLIQKKILKEDDKNYYFCTCGDKCDCQTAKGDKCECGKDLQAFPKK
jgi:hypothetical protein